MKKVTFDWISEDGAAKLMGYAPKTLRRYCREGKLPAIVYTQVNYSTYEYCKNSIDDSNGSVLLQSQLKKAGRHHPTGTVKQ
jgi:hypothetical protein